MSPLGVRWVIEDKVMVTDAERKGKSSMEVVRCVCKDDIKLAD